MPRRQVGAERRHDTASVALISLSIRGFRNLAPLDIEVPAGTVLLLGANGAGKTNVLEAIAVLGNLLSFRPGPAAAWFARGSESFALSGVIERAGTTVEIRQAAWLRRHVVRTLHRGARRLEAAEYLELFPVTAFSSHDRALVWGGPEDRRRFLDRFSYQLHPDTLLVAQRYRRALRQRNALLTGPGSDQQLEAFEHDMALLGARLIHLRLDALSRLEAVLPGELERLGWSLPRLNLRYHGADGELGGEQMATSARLAARLARMRATERARGHTIVGPHRHDLALTVAGQPARDVLSAGQGKLLATALKLAALAVVVSRGARPTVVFDDVDAELDAGVLERVLARLQGAGQLLLSSAHDDVVVPRVGADAVWRIAGGMIAGRAGGGV